MSHNPFAQVDTETKAITSSVRQPGIPASAVYEGIIKAAYMIQNNWTPTNIDLALHIELDNGYEYKIQKTVLQGNSPMTVDKKTQKKVLLYTYVQMSHIVGAAVPGKTLGDLFDTVQNKKIELYDFDTKSNVLTDVKMVTGLLGKKLLLGLQRKISNQVEKTPTGEWVNKPESRQTLEFGVAASIEDRRTFTEITSNAPAEDLDKWEKLNAGKDWDAYKEVKGVATGVPPSVTPAGNEVFDFSTSV